MLLIKHFFSSLFFIGFCSILQGQVQLTTPLELLSFMEASPTQYVIEPLYLKAPVAPTPVITHGSFVEMINKKEYLFEYNDFMSCKSLQQFKKARDLVNRKDPDYKKARKHYSNVLKEIPDHAQVITYIGESYYNEFNFKTARQYFNKAIEINPMDYLARWLLAEIHLKNNQTDSAVYAITLAHLYNRNHPLLLKRMRSIYAQDDQNYIYNWHFNPQFFNYYDGQVVVINASGIWLTYAMYKAVWKFEPDYLRMKRSQKVSDYIFQEEMEACIGTYITYAAMEQKDKTHYTEMKAFERSLDNKMVEEFVMYEALMPARPYIVYHSTDAFLERIIRYIKTVRGYNFN